MANHKILSIVRAAIDEVRRSGKKELYLDSAHFADLDHIPGEVFELTELETLSIGSAYGGRRTNVTEIPSAIGRLTRLTTLVLAKNRIQHLPPELFELRSLRQLYLAHNDLTTVPDGISSLTELRKLDLSHNRLTLIPPSISDLLHLETLDLNNNALASLPLTIGKLDRLIRLSVSRNQIKNVPLEILSQPTEAIRNYCRAVLADQTVRLYEAKLLIVGEGGVCKSSLLNRLAYGSFSETETTTEGIDIHRWTISSDSIKSFRVNIWDFGGQEIHHATHQFFLTKRSLYLFVWIARSDEVDFDYWLNIIRLLSNNSPVLIVLNKADERIKMLDERFIQQRFTNVIGFLRVSARTGAGIADLADRIKRDIVALEHVGNVLPRVWVTVREELEKLNRAFVDYREYLEMCAGYGLDAEHADFMSLYYHDLGVFLHFQDNYILRNIIFLKPEWATAAVYKLIDTKEVIKRQGRFTFQSLRQIWSDYPVEKHVQLVELMKKFELCFQIGDSGEYIVPELLPPSTPTALEWNYADNLRFEFHYDFMPSGILTRFIVITHHLIFRDSYWKNGVILKRSDTRCLVISDPFNRKIQVWVDGEDKADLMAIVRERVEYIHGTLNHPAVKEMLKCVCSECERSDEPFFFEYATLKKFYFKGKGEIPCSHSAEDVSIERLLGGIENTRRSVDEEILEALKMIASKNEDEESVARKANEILELKPNFMGIGININEIVRRFFRDSRGEQRDDLALPPAGGD
jgi:small GTP-binding protein